MTKRWSVWVSQSFGTYVDVEAETSADAQEKALDVYYKSVDFNMLEEDGDPEAGIPEPDPKD